MYTMLCVILACTGFAIGASLGSHVQPLHYAWKGRIVGGDKIAIEEAPYQVSLQYKETHWCGGSIISNEWVLTAAHCMQNPAFPEIVPSAVRAGSSLSETGGTIHQIGHYVMHEKYRMVKESGFLENDIAVVRVIEPFEFSAKCQPIPLFAINEFTEPGTYAFVTGYGYTLVDFFNEDLRGITVPIISFEECREAYAPSGTVIEGQICAAYPEGGKDACQGDSGGPLAIQGRLAGVISWGLGCGDPGQPGVYAEVAYYRQWIFDHSGV